ncbi:hypothetical protein ISN44_As13g007570 [Arabidopsis suecica]|uniref:Uncharacterized protein n=1 Tax=Arabidopsis suecica TaxID=45249 RepID=A0A8T1Y0F1_ARASU|nr:hypothetical protein ISN44_As13g007570 [Arabidopsis suecica]
MATKSKAVTDVISQNYRSQPSMEEQMAIVVKRVGEVVNMVPKSPLYWESIELLAKDEVSRGIFYALPNECKLHYLKRKTHACNQREEEPFYGESRNYDWD